MQIQKQFDKQFYYNIIPDSKRQQTTTVDYKRLINGFFLTNSVTLQHQICNTMEYCISTILDQNEGEKKTSGLLPNCRMRNRLPVILRNLQQMPIKRQAQTVLYPMFPNAKIQLFHNMQVSSRKITQNNAIMSKITIFVPY